MIELVNIAKSYAMGEHRVRALVGINLLIRSGEFVAVQGTSGSGKSTLLNILGILDSAESGTYTLDGHPCLLYTSPSPRDGLLSRMPSSA